MSAKVNDFIQFAIFAAMEKTKKGTAIVIKHTGSHYLLSELPKWDLFPVVIRGKLRLSGSTTTNPIAVGDKVSYQVPLDDDGNIKGEGTITEVFPRRNYIIRKSTNLSRQSHIIAANIDMAFLIVTLGFPETKWAFIDRFLLTCEVYKVPVTILLNKIDIYGDEYREMVNGFKKIYNEEAGYPIIEVSATKNINIDKVRDICAEGDGSGVFLFSGVSGVGKSSLIKALDPLLSPKVGEISISHLQGKHTTTFYEMHPLSSGGFIIDTPGIRGFGLVDLEAEEISKYFPEMLAVMDNCKFMPCTHTHEPYCAVKEAVADGCISEERYNSYLGKIGRAHV